MKKLFFVMAAVAALLTSCSKDDTFGGPTRGKVTFEVSTPELATRYGEGDNATKLYYAVYDMVENGAKVHESTTTLTNGAADVKIDLVEGRKYTAIFWADADSKSPYKFDAANKTVSYKDGVTLTANNEDYDAFYAFVPQDAIKVGETVDVDLKRPFAQLNIATNDTEKAKNLQVEVVNTAVTVAGVYTSFNLENGQVQGERTTVNFTSAAKANGQIEASKVTYDLLAMNYLLVNPEKETLVDVTFNFTDMVGTEEQNYVRQYNDIKVQRNYRTNVIGSILTDETIFDVDIEEGFLTPDKTEEGNDSATQVVSNAQDLQEMINNAKDGEETTLVLDGDINLNVDTRAEAVTYINIPVKKNITLDLNGYTISGTDKNTSGNYYLIDNRGTLTILDNSVAKDGIINLTATTDRDWNASSVVVANNPGGKLTVNGGTIEHLGGTDMAYGIDNLTNGKGTYAETIINGGTVKSTYRAIRQFLNGVEAQNILTVNGGTIKGTNKSIWMQDPSKNANTGKLTVGANAQLKGDVYLFVTEGSTEWPVEVSIAAAALQDESTVMYANVPAGKSVVLEDGYYIVKDGYYVNNATELQAALNTAPDGTIIYFANDIESASAIVINEAKGNTQKKITIDGLNNKFTGMFKINGQSDNNNNAATYIKNINFETSSKNIDGATAFIWGGSSDSDTKWRYANNVTIENCSFTATGAAENVVAGVILYQNYGYVKMSNVTATGLHSLIQNSPSEGPIQIDGAKITNGKNGISLNKNVSGYIKNVTINTTGYGIRIANSETTTIDIELENVNITSEVPVAARNITNKVTSGNITFKGNNTLTSPDNNHYQVIITSSSDETKTEMPTGSYTLTGADEFKVFPRDYVDLSQTIIGNISASGTAIFVDSSVTESELGTFQFEVDGQMQSMSGLVVNNATITAETGIECNTDTSIYLENATFNCNTALKIDASNITIYALDCNFIVPEGGKICEAATGQMLIKNCKINGEDATVTQIKELCFGGIANGIMSF